MAIDVPRNVLADLVESTPDERGKWFAAAKSAAFYDEAIALVQSAPADPKTLGRAARDFADKRPLFAMEAALAGRDIREIYLNGATAAANADRVEDYHARVRAILPVGNRAFADLISDVFPLKGDAV